MIFCFSGTGNSRAVAHRLHEILGDEVTDISCDTLRADISDGRVIWIFPIHGWGMPKVVEKAIKHANLKGAEGARHYLVCTCGDDIGMSDKLWRKALKAKGWQATGAFSVQMPNNYVCLPGFNVDPQEVSNEKIKKMPERIEHIAVNIRDGISGWNVVRGDWPRIKSHVLRPLFMRFYTSPRYFKPTVNCVGCGKCAKACPLGAIAMHNRTPKWNEKCTMCLRCYHICPHHAIDYAHAASRKGQYFFIGK